MNLKSLISKIHLWLGLGVFPIVFFICITGTIIVFADEIMELSAGQARYVKEVKQDKIPIETILANLKKAYPERRIPSYMVAYKDPERSIRFNSYEPKQGLRMLYVDPYTGEILKEDATIHFFYITAHLHNSFLWHGTGEWIVDISVIIFVILLISGMVLWWPKSWDKKHRKASFAINLKSNVRRFNHDLHAVGGFYSFAIALLLSVTGLIIAYTPLSQATIKLFGGNAAASWEENAPLYNTELPDYPINDMLDKAFAKFPNKDELQLYTFFLKDKGYLPVKATKKVNLKSTQTLDFVVYNRHTGEEMPISEEAILTEKIENTFWMLHMGSWGLLGKIITFLGGLILSCLPITGFLIWRNKYLTTKRNQAKFNAF